MANELLGLVDKTTGTGVPDARALNMEWEIAGASPQTAVSKRGYLIDVSSAAHTQNLPASPTVGDIVGFHDFKKNASTNNITIGRNSQPIDGDAADLVVDLDGATFVLVYTDGTTGWAITQFTQVV